MITDLSIFGCNMQQYIYIIHIVYYIHAHTYNTSLIIKLLLLIVHVVYDYQNNYVREY